MTLPTHTSPRPWAVVTRRSVLVAGSWVEDRNGVPVATNLRPQDAELIVATVNALPSDDAPEA